MTSSQAKNKGSQARAPHNIHLSVVAASRNDDHGGNMLQRMQHFVDGFIAQCQRHNISAELILVEWNPPADRPPLVEALRWPDDLGPCEIRIVTVPREIHARFEHAKSLPFFQMIAKNVGIRRARGTYVLATNVDILFNDELFVYMRDRLRPGRVVRVDRFDVPANIPAGVPFDQIQEFCERTFHRISVTRGILNIVDGRLAIPNDNLALALISLWYCLRIPRLRPKPGKWLLRLVRSSLRPLGSAAALSLWYLLRILRLRPKPGDWLLRRLRALGASAARCRTAFSRLGYYASKIFPLSRLPIRSYWLLYRVVRTPKNITVRALGAAAARCRTAFSRLGFFTRTMLGYCLMLVPHGGSREVRWLERLLHPIPPKGPVAPLKGKVHTNACGDFTLLSREDWFALRANPEWHMFSWHLDSVLVHASYYTGIKQVNLGPKYRIFHMHQEVGSGWSPEGENILFERLDANGIPYLSLEKFYDLSREMYAKKLAGQEIVYNDENWGLANVVLPEAKVCRPQMATSLEAS